MRLYAKLLLMILITCSIQRYAPPAEWGGPTWFGLRCHFAHLTDDRELQTRLVDEDYRKKRSTDDEARMNIDLELAYLAAVASGSG